MSFSRRYDDDAPHREDDYYDYRGRDSRMYSNDNSYYGPHSQNDSYTNSDNYRGENYCDYYNNNKHQPRRSFSRQDAEDMWQKRDGNNVAHGGDGGGRFRSSSSGMEEDRKPRAEPKRPTWSDEDGSSSYDANNNNNPDDDLPPENGGTVQPMKCASLPPAAVKSSSSSSSSAAAAAAASNNDDESMTVFPRLDEIPKLLQLDLFEKLGDGDDDGVATLLCKLSDLMMARDDGGDWTANENRNEVISLGGHAIVLVAMRNFPNHAQVQLYGMRCIGPMAEFQKISYAIIESGGLELIVHAIHEFPELHITACWTLNGLLRNLVPNPAQVDTTKLEVSMEKAATRFIVNAKGISVVLEMMKRYPDNRDIQRKCCGIWSRLGALGGTMAKDAMKNANVASAVFATMDRFPDDNGLQKCVARFMVEFFGSGGGNEKKKVKVRKSRASKRAAAAAAAAQKKAKNIKHNHHGKPGVLGVRK